jgi:TorA maturation chaperone TorD
LSNAPDLQAEFARTFLFPVETRIVPVESVYRPWTVDPTATMSFAHSKGYLLGDAAHHMKHLYDLYDLKVPAELEPVPDHLCLELEFAALLLRRGEPEKYLIFVREHLNWVGELALEAAEKQIPLFYRHLLQSLAAFLAKESTITA